MTQSGEFTRIALFLRAFQEAGGRTSSERVPLGPGDDGAILRTPGNLVVTTDTLVEGVHFRRRWASWAQIGARSAAVNLSDLAAMGARPLAFTCALVVPPDVDDEALAEIARGLAQAAREWDFILAGGNFSRGGELSLTLTAFGTAGDQLLRRDAARVGDSVLLVGEVGVAAAELAWLEQGRTLPLGRSALLDPYPQIAAGLVAGRQARCGIDVSDGLVQDLGHVARASGVGILLDFEAIPRPARFLALTAGKSPAEQARCLLAGGDDYALVVIAAPGIAGTLLSDIGGTIIGRVVAGSGIDVPNAPAGSAVHGHDHFRPE